MLINLVEPYVVVAIKTHDSAFGADGIDALFLDLVGFGNIVAGLVKARVQLSDFRVWNLVHN